MEEKKYEDKQEKRILSAMKGCLGMSIAYAILGSSIFAVGGVINQICSSIKVNSLQERLKEYQERKFEINSRLKFNERMYDFLVDNQTKGVVPDFYNPGGFFSSLSEDGSSIVPMYAGAQGSIKLEKLLADQRVELIRTETEIGQIEREIKKR